MILRNIQKILFNIFLKVSWKSSETLKKYGKIIFLLYPSDPMQIRNTAFYDIIINQSLTLCGTSPFSFWTILNFRLFLEEGGNSFKELFWAGLD